MSAVAPSAPRQPAAETRPGPDVAALSRADAHEGLDRAVDNVTRRLEALARGEAPPPFEVPERSLLPFLGGTFRLDEVELEMLVLAAGHELHERTNQAIEAINGTGSLDGGPLSALFGTRWWEWLCPGGALRRWRLVEVSGSGPLRERSVHLDERILHALCGTTYADARLAGLLEPTEPSDQNIAQTDPAAQALRRIVIGAWQNEERPPLILLGGRDRLAKRELAATACRQLGLLLYRLRADDIPADWTQRSALAILLDRELALSGAALLVESGAEQVEAAATLVDLLSGPVMLSAGDPPLPDRAPRLRLDLDPPGPGSRRDLWRRALGTRAEALGSDLDRIAGQFALDASDISATVTLATRASESDVDRVAGPADAVSATTGDLGPLLWKTARLQGRRRLDGLADRIESQASWDDLVLPPDRIVVLHDLADHVREAWRVNEEWGWAARNPRGLGAAALFAGPSGTGKTLAAEVLAADLALDLYRIDLSQVVSKYIGETEKNLARIFRAAEDGGAVLLFDEADALFGKRSEVRDSHDRYANVEISYLLQRMEAYRGLAVLTTNIRSALDTAFLRRLRYVIGFPFPDAAARAAIWARIFPPETPTEGLRPERLAQLNLSGGSIRSIALNAACLAAAGSEPVRRTHVRKAAQREYAKLEKPLTAAEQRALQ